MRSWQTRHGADGQAVSSDGPFAEVKEQLAGFYLVECDSMERAVEIAAQIPEARGRPDRGPPDSDLQRAG